MKGGLTNKTKPGLTNLASEPGSVISEIQADIEKIEAETAIYEYANFNARTNAIDFIGFHIVDRIEGLIQQFGQKHELIKLRIYISRIKDKLDDIDTAMFLQLEQQIKIAADKGSIFKKIIDNILRDFQYDEEQSDTIGYDNFDILVNRLLSTNTIREAKRELESEMIFYQKTPARVIVELCKKVSRNDVFFDIGSGIGQAVILVNLISGAKAIGIEMEPSFYNYAKEMTSKLQLTNAEFINEDARRADYSVGTIFFLYTPFFGKMMQHVLALLQKTSLKKIIRIFTYGPCSMTIAQQNWLQCINGKVDNDYKLYEFKSLQFENLSTNL